jgi:hypothetical protein
MSPILAAPILVLFDVDEVCNDHSIVGLNSEVLDKCSMQCLILVGINFGHLQHAITFQGSIPQGIVEIALGVLVIPVTGLLAVFELFQPFVSHELILLWICMEQW